MSRFPRICAAIGTVALVSAAFGLAGRLIAPPADAPSGFAALAEEASSPEEQITAGKRPLGLGRPALPEEIAAWDIDIRPDGAGLPDGSGTVAEGETIYVEQCAVCHGDFGEGIGRWPVLAGGKGTLAGDDPVKTVGSYWPFLSTVYDYVRRAMPFGNAQSLSDDEVYALTAYILYLNFIVEDPDFELSKSTFAKITMPNHGRFFMDNREEAEFESFKRAPCMSDCKESVEITMRSQVLDVTPDDEAARKRRQSVTDSSAEDAAADKAGASTEKPKADEQKLASAPADTAPDPDLVAKGETVFRQCKACHQVGEDAKNRVGPHLNDVFGRQIAGVDGFRYSPAFKDKADKDFKWTEETLAAYLKDPRGYIKGTRMAFAGLKAQEDIAAVIAYLKRFEK